MVTAINVANTFLERAFKEGVDITPMKLQKLIYIFYKEYLKETKSKVFTDEFEVWKYGPVISFVYDCFKKYGSNTIKDYYKNIDGSYTVVKLIPNSDFFNIFNKVWSLYGNKDGIYLSMLTHEEGTAWSKAWESGRQNIIDEDIYNEVSYV